MRIARYDLEELIGYQNLDPETAIREKYGWSGQSECLGLVFEDDTQWWEFVVDVTEYAKDGDDQVLIGSVQDVKGMVRRARTDSMGEGVIVFWPYGGLEIVDG